MIVNIGYIALILTLILNGLFVINIFKPINYTRLIPNVQFCLLSISFGALIYSYIISDFSLLNVAKNSHNLKPLFYKITGVWGNHEGSMLLLIWLTSLYIFLYNRLNNGKERVVAIALVILSLIIIFLITVSNPFEKIYPVPTEGRGLNPLLQDVGLAIHPPILYLGYTGFIIPFALGIEALLKGDANKQWAKETKPWVMLPWSFLTLGIGIGSWWAYRELGWGGYWFWDPVENVSLLPWLTATALFHSIIALGKRSLFPIWTVFLAIITFSLCLIGNFLVRSGLLTSVHSFASSPERGIVLLFIIALIVGFAILLFGLKSHLFYKTQQIKFLSKESAILFNNIFMITLGFTVFLGTIYPIILELFTHEKISIGTGFYENIFIPITIPILALMAVSIVVNWHNSKFRILIQKFLWWNIIAIILTLIAIMKLAKHSYLIIFSLYFANILISCMLIDLVQKLRIHKSFFKLPVSYFIMFIAHLAVGILAIAVIFSNANKEEKEVMLSLKENIVFVGFNITFKDIEYAIARNYVTTMPILDVKTLKGDEITSLNPEKRLFPVERMVTAETDIYSAVFYDLYAAASDIKDNNLYLRLYYSPLISFIWVAVIILFISGIISVIYSWKKHEY